MTDYLFGVFCSSGTTCLAVGDSSMYPPENTALVEVWNGASWSIVASANVNETTDNALFDVSCSVGNDCLAVGVRAVGLAETTLTERWNGTKWSIVAGPNTPGTTNSHLVDVSCTTSTHCFAVGDSYNTSTHRHKVLIERLS